VIAKDGAQGPTGATGPAGEVNERTANTWWNASKACGDLNASLCTWDEWYYTCQKSGSGTVNMTNDWEWTNYGQPGGTSTATVVGNTACDKSNTAVMTATNTFRCCFAR